MKYTFSAPEIYDLSHQLANKTKELATITEEKKSVVSQYGARINEAKATTNRLSNLVADGYEFREFECEVEYHTPEQGKENIDQAGQRGAYH